MVITNPKLVKEVWNHCGFWEKNDPIDLNNPKNLEELTKIKYFWINNKLSNDFFKTSPNESSLYEQLCYLVEKLPNLKEFYLEIDKNDQENINKLLESLINKTNVSLVNTGKFQINYDALYNIVNKSARDNYKIIVSKLSDVAEELKYVNCGKKIRKNIYVNNFNNLDYWTLHMSIYRSFPIPIELYYKYKDILPCESYSIGINNVNELSVEDAKKLKSNPLVNEIYVNCGSAYENEAKKSFYYTIDEYIEIKKKIDNIVSSIKMPSNDNPDREKIIFTQVYKILGKNIKYDHFAASKEQEDNHKLQANCRNLKNSLLGTMRDGKKEYLTICGGYATLLQNICSCLNIKCEYISSCFKPDDSNEIERGHAYNAVRLDEQSYLCDLTWDCRAMSLDGGIAQNFLCSYDDFEKSHKDIGFKNGNLSIISQDCNVAYSLNKDDYAVSLPYKKQIDLLEITIKNQIDDMISENYLSGFVADYLEYINQCKDKTDIKDYLDIIGTIKYVESIIKSNNFNEKNLGKYGLTINGVVRDINDKIIGTRKFFFYPGSEYVSIESAKKSVEDREDREWKKL